LDGRPQHIIFALEVEIDRAVRHSGPLAIALTGELK